MRWVLRATLVLGVVAVWPVLARADDEADMKALIDKAIKAHGGAANLSKYKAVTMKFKGKVYAVGDGVDYTGELAVQAPGQLRTDIMVEAGGMKFSVVNVLNGDKGWTSLNGKTEDMPKDAIEEGKEELYADSVGRLYVLQDKEFKLSPLGASKVGEKETIGLRVSKKGHRDVNMYFDKKSGLLLKLEQQIKDVMMGGVEVTQESLYDDYKDVSGIQHARKLVIKRGGKDYVDAEITEISVHEKLDDKTFDKP